MAQFHARLEQAIRSAGVPIVGMSFPDITNKATWTVTPVNLQAAAQPVIDAFNPNDTAADNLATFTATSRQKDTLTTCAVIARARLGVATWNGLTAQQKKDAALAEADVWITIRQFIEANI